MEITVSKTKLDETKIKEGVNSLLYGARMNPSHDLQSEVKLDSVSFLAKIMPKKVSYCVPYCSNNFRNNSSLHYYRIPRDRTIRKEYVRLLWNENLKLESQNTQICSQHFGGKKRNCKHLPFLFPWTTEKPKCQALKRISTDQVQVRSKKKKKSRVEHLSEDTDHGQLIMNDQIPCNKEQSTEKSHNTTSTQTETFLEKLGVDFGTQTETFPEELEVNSYKNRISQMEAEIRKLTIELEDIKRKWKMSNLISNSLKINPKTLLLLLGF